MSEYLYRSPVHCFDVALREPFLSDHFDPSRVTKLLTPEEQHLTTFIGKIIPSGTCFVFSKPKGNIFIRQKKVLAFALTNFNAVYDIVTRKVKETIFISFNYSDDPNDDPILDNLHYNYKSSPILELHSKLISKQKSNHSNFYCLPNDIAVLAIYQSIPFERKIPNIERCLNFNILPFAESNEVSDYNKRQVLISGYPTGSNNLRYMLPDSHGIPDAENKVRNGFHNFKQQVNSEGLFELSDSGIAELQLSSTTGMSGSPILTGTSRNSKIIGIYCGGPPLEGQIELIQIIRELLDKNYENALKIFLSLPFEDQNLYKRNPTYSSFKNSVLTILYHTGSHEIKDFLLGSYPEIINSLISDLEIDLESILGSLQDIINPLLVSTVVYYKKKEIFTYNIGISAKTEAFDYIRQFQILVEHLNFDFDCEQDFNRYLLDQLNLN